MTFALELKPPFSFAVFFTYPLEASFSLSFPLFVFPLTSSAPFLLFLLNAIPV